MWTYQTHYPYFFSGELKNYSTEDAFFNRYLNALNHSDGILQKVVDELKQDKLSDSTLIVVVGDHGEAFGRHGQITHARKIYEENIHVPCVFINPGFAPERRKEVGGLVDVAPTIMDILGYAPHDKWQGTSLFAEQRENRVYFFAPWNDYLFGYREGNEKFIYDASHNSTEIYNLKDDPEETRNLAPGSPEKIKIGHQRLAAWSQFVNQFIDSVIRKPNNPEVLANKK
jgi:arylsulfatase A-like enzyme